MDIKYYLEADAYKPSKAHREDAGLDIRTPIAISIPANGSGVIDTGVHIAIPVGYVGFLKSKSGLNVKFGLEGEGVIDAGYTGSIVVKMYNHSSADYYFDRGDKLIQLVIIPIPDIDMVEADFFEFESWITSSARGNGGFGSTGK